VRNPVEASDPPRPSSKQELIVWQGSEVAAFLTGTAEDRLSGAWHLLATTGMRRGEVLGLRWIDVDLDAMHLDVIRTLVIAEAQGRGRPGYAWGTPKTAKGRRRVSLDAGTVAALRLHRARQAQERLLLGAGYVDEGLVAAQADGRPVNPKTMSWYFEREVKRLGLPRIRLHDLRHTNATLALKAGVNPRVVQERLGHANVSITLTRTAMSTWRCKPTPPPDRRSHCRRPRCDHLVTNRA
jgi:integrase